MPNNKIQSLTVNGVTYDIVDNTSGYINAQYIENKTDYSIPVSRVGEIVVGETAIGTNSTNFPTSKAVVDYVDERVVQEIDAIDVGVISVNGKTGSVTLSASDVGAASQSDVESYVDNQLNSYDSYIHNEIPTSTSQLTNDSGFITASDVPTPDLSSYMQKGVDYVTAGKKSGTTLGNYATAEGYNTTASGVSSHAEGNTTTATGLSSHAEGYQTQASEYSHAEGKNTVARLGSHAEGENTTASGSTAHAEGYNTTASGNFSHAEGYGTTAQRMYQHVFGEYNVADTYGTNTSYKGQYIEIVGNGTADNDRSNARTLDWSGNEVLTGKLTVGAGPTNNMDVATKQYVDNSIPTVPTNISSFTNDSGYLTASDIASVMTYKGTKANYAALPVSGNTTGDVWHLTDTGAEWAWDGSAWQELGTAIDLSGYVESSRTADSTTINFSNTGTIGSIQSTYQGTDNESYIQVTADENGAGIELYASDNNNNSNQMILGPAYTEIHNVISPIDDTDAANKKYVDDSIGALSIPTKTSDLTNDSGFLTSFTETDPTVPSWAKASTKPSYGLTEISGTDDLRAIEALTGTSGLLKKTAANTWTLDTNTYLTSYTETDPTVPSWAKASTKPTYTAAEVGALPDTTTIPSKTSDLTNDSGFITSYTDEKLGLSLASSPVYYYPILTIDTTTAGKKSYDNDGFQYYNYNGTTSDVGNAKLTLGNNKTATTAKNKRGTLELYGSTAYAIRITAGAPTVIRNIEFPNKDGTIALTSDIPTVPTKVSDLTNDSGFISSYTETDPVFTASAAAGITSTDISNWNAKVSDDKTWNGVTLSQGLTYTAADQYIPVKATNALSGTASQTVATPTPTQYRIAKYDNNACLNSTTPSANDNSTKVATTAYVDNAIPKVYSSTNTGGYLTMATLPIYDGTVV